MTYDKMTDVERVARAISVPQHHTTWDLLSEQEKDLFRMQAEYAIAALQSAAPVEDDVRKVLRRNRKALEGIPKQLFVVGDLVGLIQDNAALIERLSSTGGKEMGEVDSNGRPFDPVKVERAAMLLIDLHPLLDHMSAERIVKEAGRSPALTGGVTQADVGVTEALETLSDKIETAERFGGEDTSEWCFSLAEIRTFRKVIERLAMLRASQTSGEGSDDKETA